MMKIFAISLLLIISAIDHSLAQEDYESKIVFYGFKNSINDLFISTFNEPIENFGCGPHENVSIISHGWLEGLNTTEWVNTTIINLLKYSKGCVFFMDYSAYSKHQNYFILVSHYEGIKNILTRKLKQIGHPERIFMFGFSFGSRLSIDSAISAFNGEVGRMELCDPAGPGFEGSYRVKNPKLAAKNVACISTSSNYGTTTYNCHQNFRMGNCGHNQPAHGSYPKGSHGLCPHIFNSAFYRDFTPHNYYSCDSNRAANVSLDDRVKLGYLGRFDRNLIQGDIFIPTAGREPYLSVNVQRMTDSMEEFVELLNKFDSLQFEKREDEGDEEMVKIRSEIWSNADKVARELHRFIGSLSKSTLMSMT